MSVPLPAILIALVVLFVLFATTAGVEAIVLKLFRWGPSNRCVRDATVATASAFMPGRFELLQLSFTDPLPLLELFAWGAVVLATEIGVYVSLSRLGNGNQLRTDANQKLTFRVIATAVAANVASHMVLVAFVYFVTRLAGR
ncbi:MAG: hypothetical protein JNK05_22170 [Myxococcales bacterium]|nr:hypothetical protein [Myxococcales bacterium]